ncbi:MAG: threonine synthase, partial [Candidatus Hydrothermarchaeota archaeon]|nr:threonine synthase [Candidatus Hydrothermarchaeota archaeon]
MSYVVALKCRNCGEKYPIKPISICDECFGPLEVEYDFEKIKEEVSREKIEKGPKSIWRYKDLLPAGKKIVDLNTGFTPLHEADNLAEKLG